MSKETKSKPVAEKKFSIFRISEEGLLKAPKNNWGNSFFANYYDSEDSAMEHIYAMQEAQQKEYFCHTLVIMPVIRLNNFPKI